MSRIAYVSGRLGAGKSSLAAPLAAELGYSLVTKDLIKLLACNGVTVIAEAQT